MMRFGLLAAALCSLPFADARAQDPSEAQASEPEAPAAKDEPVPSQTSSIWIAGAAAGWLQRDGGPDSPYGTLSLTRYHGQSYLRGAVTAYRGTVEQIDAALPSTYFVGSIGAGGNWSDWVVDAFASYGRQVYGKVETVSGKRDSQAGSGAPYFAAGLRAGHVFRPAPRWYVTPTLGIQYSDTRSLRHRVDFISGRAEDFQLRENAWTGNAALRIDRALGRSQQHFVGVSLAHYESDNGLTSWRLNNPAGANQPMAIPTPDGWEEFGLSATWRLSERIWLDNEVRRTFGAVAGDTSSFTIGVRFQM